MNFRKPIACLILALGLSALGAAHAGNHHAPSSAQIQDAQDTGDLMTNTVIAALLKEIGETTPENAGQGSRSISLIFNDHNHDMRLVGTLDPLRDNDYPEDSFEEDALESAMDGVAFDNVERIHGKWYHRRSIPLSNFAPQCAMCHANFADLPSDEIVGALMLRVPIEQD